MYTVVDRAGRLIELEDHVPVPDGYRLMQPLMLMDGVQRAVARQSVDPYRISDQQRLAIEDAREKYKIRLSAGMHRHRVELDPEELADSGDADPRVAAYNAYKKRLTNAWRAGKARKARRPVDPSWQKL
jgi:hypothetical protein